MNRLVYVLNGCNLDMLGRREPELYGTTPLAEVKSRSEALARQLGLDCDFRQTNHEGVLVDWLHEAFERDAAVIINPSGFSFASIPVFDALKLIARPIIEVHITNIHRRSPEYHHSLVSKVAQGVICGLGVGGYALALRSMAELLDAAA